MANICGAPQNNDVQAKYTDDVSAFLANEAGVRPRDRETVSEQDEKGAFVRQPNYFTAPITPEDAVNNKYSDGSRRALSSDPSVNPLKGKLHN